MLPIPQNVQAFPEFYGGQMGVEGSETPLGLRFASSARTIYVDSSHPEASDANDGTNPYAPKLTIGGGVAATLLANGGMNGDQIFVAPATAEYSESVVITDPALYASYVRLVGLGSGMYYPYWASGGAALPCLVPGAVGWSIEGFRFVPNTAAAAIVVPRTAAPYASGVGIRTRIQGNYFDGEQVGLMGIDLHGAPWNVEILNNMFGFIHNAGGTAICIASTDVSIANDYRTRIQGNWFHESDSYINASCNGALIAGNYLQPASSYAMTAMIDLRGGTLGKNMVVGNYLSDDYAQAGGYYPNAANPGNWVGNFAEDVAEAEVGDNGITVAPPA